MFDNDSKEEFTLDRDEYKTLLKVLRQEVSETIKDDNDEEWIEFIESYISRFVEAGDPEDCYEEFTIELDKFDIKFFIRLMIYNTELSFVRKEYCEKLEEENKKLEDEIKLLKATNSAAYKILEACNTQ